ncbi:hypothetical protein ACFL9U_07665 [Thermodesulfobacteriota bacterium]
MQITDDWIPFGEGAYIIEQAILCSIGEAAVMLEEAVLEIRTGPLGKKQMRGRALARNIFIVELHEESDRLDLILDLGGEFKFRMDNPQLIAGKVFSPNIKSSLQFIPRKPWTKLSVAKFETLLSKLKFLPE